MLDFNLLSTFWSVDLVVSDPDCRGGGLAFDPHPGRITFRPSLKIKC